MTTQCANCPPIAQMHTGCAGEQRRRAAGLVGATGSAVSECICGADGVEAGMVFEPHLRSSCAAGSAFTAAHGACGAVRAGWELRTSTALFAIVSDCFDFLRKQHCGTQMHVARLACLPYVARLMSTISEPLSTSSFPTLVPLPGGATVSVGLAGSPHLQQLWSVALQQQIVHLTVFTGTHASTLPM